MKTRWIKYLVILILIITTKTAFASRQPIAYQSELDYPSYKVERNGYYTGFDMDISNMVFNNEKNFFGKSEFYMEQQTKKILIAVGTCAILLLLIFTILRLYIKKLSKKLYNENKLIDDIINNTSIVIIAANSGKKIVKCNENIKRFGLSMNQVINKKYNTLKNIDKSYSFIEKMLDRALKLDLTNNEEVQVENQDGSSFVYSFRTSVIYDSDGRPETFLLAGIDVTESKEYECKLQQSFSELEATYEELVATEEELKEQYNEMAVGQEKLRFSEERFRLATEASNDIIWEEHPSTKIAYYSDRWYEILGYPRNEDDNSYQMWEELVHPDDNAAVESAMNDHFEGKAPFYKCEYRLKAENGEYRWFLSKGKAIKNANGEIIRFIGCSTDITELKNSQLKLQRLAYIDSLTYLPNKTAFKEEFGNVINGDDTAALLYIDMDNFKYINDTMGHSYGDKVLRTTGKELAHLLGERGTVYRLGGDEFSIIIPSIRNREAVEEIAHSILEGFKKPFDIQGVFINISLSMGISIYPWDSKLSEDLIVYADIAMYKSKELGKGKYTFYNESMREAIERRITIEKYLRDAIDNNELYLLYQPQYDIKTGKIDGFEALLRWKSSILGSVPPLSFIKIAEESQLIIPIGEWILKTACLFLKSLQENGYNSYRISVNISIVQLIQENFVEDVLNILNEIGIPEELLELEITESILMESFDRLNNKLEILRSKGIRIALDDFGTGYSSLSYLRKLKVNTLKIDKAFINDILVNDESRALTATIIDIGHKVNLEVIAEGVEDKKQLQFLASSNCDKIQGFLFSRPVSKQDILSMLEDEKKDY